MTEVSYQEFVSALVKPGQALIDSMTPEKMDLIHMAIGVAGEGGELLDAVKKHAVYNKPIDKQNVIEELGDLEFYMQGVRNNIGVTREEVLAFNRQKLAVRYASLTYTDAAAIARADKVEGSN